MVPFKRRYKLPLDYLTDELKIGDLFAVAAVDKKTNTVTLHRYKRFVADGVGELTAIGYDTSSQCF